MLAHKWLFVMAAVSLSIRVCADLPDGCSVTNETTITCVKPDGYGATDEPDKLEIVFSDGPGYRWAPLTSAQQVKAAGLEFHADAGLKCGPDFENGGVTYYQNVNGMGFAAGVGMDFDCSISFLGMHFGLHVDDWQVSAGIVYQSASQAGGASGVRAFVVGEISKDHPHNLAQRVLIGENQTQVFPWFTILPLGVKVLGWGVTLMQLQGDFTLPDLSITSNGISTGDKLQMNLRLQGLCVSLGWFGQHCAATLGPYPVADMKIASIGILHDTVKCGINDSAFLLSCSFNVALLRDPGLHINLYLAATSDNELETSGNITFLNLQVAEWNGVAITQLPRCFSCGADAPCAFDICIANVVNFQGSIQSQLGIELKDTSSGEVVQRFTNPALAYQKPGPSPPPTPPTPPSPSPLGGHLVINCPDLSQPFCFSAQGSEGEGVKLKSCKAGSPAEQTGWKTPVVGQSGTVRLEGSESTGGEQGGTYCLESQGVGAELVLAACNVSSAAQLFVNTSVRDDRDHGLHHELRLAGSTLCVVAQGKPEPYTPVILYGCGEWHSSSWEYFELYPRGSPSPPSPSPSPSPLQRLVTDIGSFGKPFCWTAKGYAGAPVQLLACSADADDDQTGWSTPLVSQTGTVQLARPLGAGNGDPNIFCVESQDFRPLFLAACNSSKSSQQFTNTTDGSYFYLQQLETVECVVAQGFPAPYTPLIIYYCNQWQNNTWQHFKLTSGSSYAMFTEAQMPIATYV